MYQLKNVRDEALLRRLAELAVQDRRTTAELLAHLAEVESRRLHLRMGYDSMKSYCVGELHYSEGAARRRVHAAHAAATFPVLFEAIAEGRLHLSAILLVSPYLTPANVGEMIAAVSHKGRPEIEVELARRFPQPEPLPLDDGVSPQVVVRQQSNAEPRTPACVVPEETTLQRRPIPKPPAAPERIAPITVERYRVQVTIDAETHDKLREVQQLLGHTVPSCDIAEAIRRSLDLMLVHLKKRKFAQVDRPRSSRGGSSPSTISAQVKRAVYERDGDRCAHVGESGHRCGSKKQLEYDHVVPLALGGASSIENVRLVCRIHNQFEADEKLGREFMDKHRSPGRGDLVPVDVLRGNTPDCSGSTVGVDGPPVSAAPHHGAPIGAEVDLVCGPTG